MFNVTDWILQAAKLKVWSFEVEGNSFELMSLTDDLIEEANESVSSKELTEFCAVNGLCANGVRAVDIEGMTTEKLDKLWELPEINTGSEPSVYHLVGLEVLKKSELEDFYNELFEKETPEPEEYEEEDEEEVVNVISGDGMTQDQLQKTMGEYQSQQQ